MKKIILASVFSLAVSGVFAQGVPASLQDKVKEETCKTAAKDVASAEKNTLDAKKAIKTATWLKLAKAYEEQTTIVCPQDSMSSLKCYETYKKADEVDKASGGKSAKEISDALTSTKMYQMLMSQAVAYYNAKKLTNASIGGLNRNFL